jgi:sugar phosphate isomerase/epimerase
MIRAVSTYIDVKNRLHAGTLERLVRGGAQAIEIFCARMHFDYTERQSVREIAAWFKSNPIELNSLHSPLFSDMDWGKSGVEPINVATTDKRHAIESMDEIKRAIEVAEQIPFKYLVQHIGLPREEFTDRKFDATMTAIEHLRAFAKPLGVTVLVENIPNELSTPERLNELVRTAHFSDVHFCFDIGHAHINGTVEKDFDLMKDRIRSTHIHDNDAVADSHKWPGEGTIDWTRGMELLRSAPQAPPLLLEIDGAEGQDITAKLSETFRALEGQKVPA